MQSVALTLTLTLTFENDILCLLYYVHDIQASINLTNTHLFPIYDKWERSVDFCMAAILELRKKVVFRSNNFGGTYHMLFTIS